MTRPIRVLLVEDNPGDADLIRDTLETSEHQLEIAVMADGVSATDYLLRRGRPTADAPDLVFLDLNLPRRDGRAVLAEIKQHDRLRAIPVIVLTSSDAESDIVGAYAAGASCYITKPLDLETFQAVVKATEAFWFTIAKLP